MTDYKLATYQADTGARAGVVIDEEIVDAADLTGRPAYASMLAMLEDWDAAQEAIDAALARDGTAPRRPLADAKLLAPVLWPSAVYCAGANYGDHMAEMARVQNIAPEPDPRERGLKPWHFIKAPRSIVETGATIRLPAYSQMVDWEAELGAFIGRPARDVPVDAALAHVAGYTVANDLSARDAGRRPHISDTSPFKFDWVGQKSFDDACPLGPWLVPARQIADPQALGIKLWVNDVIKQDSHTSQMIFSLAEQIAYLSTRITLYPGDLILTGTPAGVGMARKEFLRKGDVVKVWVEDVGTLINTCG
jgi:2-keto-4-pentenoate hydratase/2-oxohepta-3-ene-1,7-dioic acid hydratase in catechol pathway